MGSPNQESLVGYWDDTEDFEESFDTIREICNEHNIRLSETSLYYGDDDNEGEVLAEVMKELVDNNLIV